MGEYGRIASARIHFIVLQRDALKGIRALGSVILPVAACDRAGTDSRNLGLILQCSSVQQYLREASNNVSGITYLLGTIPDKLFVSCSAVNV